MESLMICFPQPIFIIRFITSRRIKCVGHVACIGEREGAYRVLVEKPEERSRLGMLDLEVG